LSKPGHIRFLKSVETRKLLVMPTCFPSRRDEFFSNIDRVQIAFERDRTSCVTG
jgi:hypothetical protein